MPVCGAPVNETALGLVAGAITMLEAGLAVAVSALVVTVKLEAVIVPAGGLMIPAIVSAPLRAVGERAAARRRA